MDVRALAHPRSPAPLPAHPPLHASIVLPFSPCRGLPSLRMALSQPFSPKVGQQVPRPGCPAPSLWPRPAPGRAAGPALTPCRHWQPLFLQPGPTQRLLLDFQSLGEPLKSRQSLDVDHGGAFTPQRSPKHTSQCPQPQSRSWTSTSPPRLPRWHFHLGV